MSERPPSDRGDWLYGFAVAHVQSYLLASPRLRDIQGGSQLLEELCTKVFDGACRAAGLREPRILSQAAGGARLVSSDASALARLHAAWPLVADAFAPGALIQQALVDVDAAGGLARSSGASPATSSASRCCVPSGPVSPASRRRKDETP